MRSETARRRTAIFAQSPELWAAVRRYAPPAARVANNPLYLQDLDALAGEYILGAPCRSQFVFCRARNGARLRAAAGGTARGDQCAIHPRVRRARHDPGDVGELAKQYGCDVVVVVPQDGAWSNDPFAASPDYRLAESRDGQWRIYVKVPAATVAH